MKKKSIFPMQGNTLVFERKCKISIFSVKSELLMEKKGLLDGKCNRSPDKTPQKRFKRDPLLMLDKIKVTIL